MTSIKKALDWTVNNKLKIKYKSSKTVKIIFRLLFLFGMGFVMLYPILFMLSGAFRAAQDAHDMSVIWIPRNFSIEPMRMALEVIDFGQGSLATLMILVPSVILQLVSTLLAAYGFARFRFPGRSILFGILVFQIIVPSTAIIIPLYTFFQGLGILNHPSLFWIMALFGSGIRSALYIFIVRQFFKNIPKELEEAAMIDGCGPFKTFVRIMLPNIVPAIVTVTAFSVVWYWNNYYETSMLVGIGDFRTLSLRMTMIMENINHAAAGGVGGFTPTELFLMRDSILASASLLLVAPLVILYVFLQRYLTESVEKTGLVG